MLRNAVQLFCVVLWKEITFNVNCIVIYNIMETVRFVNIFLFILICFNDILCVPL